MFEKDTDKNSLAPDSNNSDSPPLESINEDSCEPMDSIIRDPLYNIQVRIVEKCESKKARLRIEGKGEMPKPEQKKFKLNAIKEDVEKMSIDELNNFFSSLPIDLKRDGIRVITESEMKKNKNI